MTVYDNLSVFARRIDKHQPVLLDIAAIPDADEIHYTFILSLSQNECTFRRIVVHGFKKPPLPASIKHRKTVLVHALIDEAMDQHGFHRVDLVNPKAFLAHPKKN